MRAPRRRVAGWARFRSHFISLIFVWGLLDAGAALCAGFRRVRFSNAAIRLRLLSFRFSKHSKWQQPVHLPPSRAPPNAGVEDCFQESTRRGIMTARVRMVGVVVKRTLRKPAQSAAPALWWIAEKVKRRNKHCSIYGCATHPVSSQLSRADN